MADVPVVFTPRPLVRPPRRDSRDCQLCGGAHASWWTNVQAPSCTERQRRNA